MGVDELLDLPCRPNFDLLWNNETVEGNRFTEPHMHRDDIPGLVFRLGGVERGAPPAPHHFNVPVIRNLLLTTERACERLGCRVEDDCQGSARQLSIGREERVEGIGVAAVVEEVALIDPLPPGAFA